MADELWQMLGREGYTYNAVWPEHDAEVARPDSLTIVLQVNGKLRDRVEVPADASEEDLERMARENQKVVAAASGGKAIRKVIVVPKRLVNVVIG